LSVEPLKLLRSTGDAGGAMLSVVSAGFSVFSDLEGIPRTRPYVREEYPLSDVTGMKHSGGSGALGALGDSTGGRRELYPM